MKNSDSGIGQFHVSDALDVALRGFLLRLRRTGGDVAAGDLAPGTRLRLRSPDGRDRTVTVRARSLTGGRNGPERFEKTGRVDLIISSEDAYAGGVPIGIGWTAEGPLRGADGRIARVRVEPVRHAGRRPTRDATSGGWPFNPPGGAWT